MEDEAMEQDIEKLLTPNRRRDEAIKLEGRFRDIEDAIDKV